MMNYSNLDTPANIPEHLICMSRNQPGTRPMYAVSTEFWLPSTNPQTEKAECGGHIMNRKNHKDPSEYYPLLDKTQPSHKFKVDNKSLNFTLNEQKIELSATPLWGQSEFLIKF